MDRLCDTHPLEEGERYRILIGKPEKVKRPFLKILA